MQSADDPADDELGHQRNTARAEAQKVKAGDEVSGPREVQVSPESQSVMRRRECKFISKTSAQRRWAGEFESDAVQGNVSLNKLCNQEGVPGCAVRRRRCRLCQNEKLLSEKLKCIHCPGGTDEKLQREMIDVIVTARSAVRNKSPHQWRCTRRHR